MTEKTELDLKTIPVYKIIEETLGENDGCCLDNKPEIERVSLALTSKMLLEDMAIEVVVNQFTNRNWKDIANECEKRGF